jgi:DNA primase
MPGVLSPATLQKVRAASDMVDVVGGSVRLKKAGASFVGLCPFHREKTPSFHVNPQRQIFHCFGCHKGGDVFTFVQEFEHVTFVEAVQRLADRAGINLEFETGGREGMARQTRELLLQIHEQIAQRWQSALTSDPGGQIARAYLVERRISPEAVRRFRLGYAPLAWDDTVNWARSKGYDLTVVEAAGLVVTREGGRPYDRFRGRLMFPINDEQGRVIGFSGRVLEPEAKTAKYVNSPETALFTKGRIIYGLDKAKRALLDKNQAVVCEGQLDTIACHMAGIEHVVAPQGTALTSEQARILRRYVDEVVLCFDADPAGENAAIRALDDLLASGLAIRVARIPPPHDPDSFIRERGGEAFRQLIDQAVSFFDFYLDHLIRTHGQTSDRGRLAVAAAMGVALRKAGSPLLLDAYAQRTAQQLGVSTESIKAEFRRAARGTGDAAPTPSPSPSPPALPLDPPSSAEFWLLRLLLLDDGSFGWLEQHLDLDWIRHPTVREIVRAWLAAHREDRWHGLPSFLETCGSADQSLLTEAATPSREVPHPADQLRALILRLRNQAMDRELASLAQQMSASNLSEADRLFLLQKQIDLRATKQQPLAPRKLGPHENSLPHDSGR